MTHSKAALATCLVLLLSLGVGCRKKPAKPASKPTPTTKVPKPPRTKPHTVPITLVNDSEVKLSITLTRKSDGNKIEHKLTPQEKKEVALQPGAYDANYSYYGGPGDFNFTSEGAFVKDAETWTFYMQGGQWRRSISQ